MRGLRATEGFFVSMCRRRRYGELLKELARGEPGRPAEIVPQAGTIRAPSPYAQALASDQISTQAAMPL